MNILVFGANWYNRGDESAIRAMVDELYNLNHKINLRFIFNQQIEDNIPIKNEIIYQPFVVENRRKHIYNWVAQNILICTGGRINLLTGKYRIKYNDIKKGICWADCAIYAPGGPCIGDIYRAWYLLLYMQIMKRNNVPYFFYAPSMGPFKGKKKVISKVLNNCDFLCVRESISKRYIQELKIKKDICVTLDSAIQHIIRSEEYEKELKKDTKLNNFCGEDDKIIGITVTDLQWNGKYKGSKIEEKIFDSFIELVDYLVAHGYKVLFIPQLFGKYKDSAYMRKLCRDNCFVLDDEHDCYFQQYMISKLYAVIGMRYHSNVFSAKMGTPFISVSYEQKTKGFMEKCGLSQYCIDVNKLSGNCLIEHIEFLNNQYNEYKNLLMQISTKLRKESYRTTEFLDKWLTNIEKNN